MNSIIMLICLFNYSYQHCLICKILICACVYLFSDLFLDTTYGEVAPKRDFKPAPGKFPFVQTPGTTCPSRILDLSTLKRQPKLL